MATVKMKNLLIEEDLYTQPIIDMGYLQEQLTKYVNRWVDFPLYDTYNKEEFIKIKSVDIKKIEPQMYFADGTFTSTDLLGGCCLANKDNYTCVQTTNLSFFKESDNYFNNIYGINYVTTRGLIKIQLDEDGNPIELKNDLVGIDMIYSYRETKRSEYYYTYNSIENTFELNENVKFVNIYSIIYGSLDFNENGYRSGVDKWLMVIFYYDMIIQKKDGTDDIYLQVPAILPLHILNDFGIRFNGNSLLTCLTLKNDIIYQDNVEFAEGQLNVYYNNRYLFIKNPDGNYTLIEPSFIYNNNNINIVDYIEFYNRQNIVVTYKDLFATIPRELLENEENF